MLRSSPSSDHNYYYHIIMYQMTTLSGLGVLLTEELGGVDHVDKGGLGLGPLAGLEATVGVDPELLWLEVLEHLLDAVLDLLLAWDTGRVDIIDTWADVAGVGGVDEDLEELGIGLGVLDGEDIGIEGSDGVEEVLELGVTEVRVDLGGVLNTGDGQAERLDGPVEVGNALLAGAEGETLTESGLVNLDDEHTSVLEVNNLVTEGKSKLLSLDGLVNIVTGERPSEAGDWASQHSLHWLLGDGDGVFGLLNGHWGWARDVTDNNRWADAAGTVRLNPSVGGESVTIETLTEVLDHVVTLRLTVNVDIEVKLLLDLNNVLDLLLNELLVLSSGDLALGELVTVNADLLGLGERTNGGGWEKREAKLLLLLGDTDRELRLAVVHGWGNLGLAVLDSGVVGALGGSTSLDRLGVGLKGLTDGVWALSDGLGNDGNLSSLLDGEGEPIGDLSVELLLAGESVRGVEEGRGGGNDDALLANLLDGGLNDLNGTLEVGLPDVATIDNTGRQDGLWAKRLDDLVKLLWVADKVNVETVDVLGNGINVVDDVTEVGGENNLGDGISESGKLLVGWLEGSLDLWCEIEDQGWLIDLDGLSTGSLELLEELNVDWDKFVNQRDWVNGLVTVWLSEGKERNWSDKDWAGGNASLLGLNELVDSLWALSKLELLVVLEGWLDVMVVRIEPLDHLQRWDIDALLLETTAHSEVLVNSVELVLGVPLWDSLFDGLAAVTRTQRHRNMCLR